MPMLIVTAAYRNELFEVFVIVEEGRQSEVVVKWEVGEGDSLSLL